MPLTLTLKSYQRKPPDRETSVTFVQGRLSIGRSTEADWSLPDPKRQVSKFHCSIDAFDDDGYVLIDTSTNGVFVNGADAPVGRDNKVMLRSGDQLRLGAYEIEVSVDQTAPSSAGAADGPEIGAPASPALSGEPGGLRLFGLSDTSSGVSEAAPPGARESDGRSPAAPRGARYRGSREIERPIRLGVPDSLEAEIGPRTVPAARRVRSGEQSTPEDWDLAPVAPVDDLHANDPVPKDLIAAAAEEIVATTPVPPLPMEAEAGAQTREVVYGTGLVVDDPGGRGTDRGAAPGGDASSPRAASPDVTGKETADAVRSFFEGAGMAVPSSPSEDGARDGARDVPRDPRDLRDTEALLRHLGRVYRSLVQGLVESLDAGSNADGDLRPDRAPPLPLPQPAEKLAAGIETALTSLLPIGGLAPEVPTEAIDESFRHLRAQHLAALGGVRSALRAIVGRLDPVEIERTEPKPDQRAPELRSARNWETYRQIHNEVVKEIEDELPRLLAQAYGRAQDDERGER